MHVPLRVGVYVSARAQRSAPVASPAPLTAERVADALIDNLGGFDAGWAMFRAAMGLVRVGVERAEESEFAFTAHPQGVWRKLMYALEDGLRLAAAACEIEELRLETAEPDRTGPARRQELARVLHERAVERADARRLTA